MSRFPKLALVFLALILSERDGLGQGKTLPVDFILQVPRANCNGPWKAGLLCQYTDYTTGQPTVKLPNGTVQPIGTGAGGGGGDGTATKFQASVGTPVSPQTRDVWYDTTSQQFCARWAGYTDCFASQTSLYRQQFNVLEFGAKGDAVLGSAASGTDDSAAVQAALTAMQSAEHGVLVFPSRRPDGTPATYRLRNTMTLDRGGNSGGLYHIESSGARIWLDATSANEQFFVFVATSLYVHGGEWFGWKGDTGATGGPTVPSYNTKNGIWCGAGRLTVEDVTVRGWNGVSAPGPANIDPDNGFLYGVDVVLRNVVFESANHNLATPSIRAGHHVYGVNGFDADGVEFIDFLGWKGRNDSLGSGAGGAIVVARPNTGVEGSIEGTTPIRLKNSRFDEGSGQLRFGDAYTSILNAPFNMPHSFYDVPNTGWNTTTIVVSDTSWMRVNDRLTIPGAGYLYVVAVVDPTHVTIKNQGGPIADVITNVPYNTAVSAGVTITSAQLPEVELDGLVINVTPNTYSIGLDFSGVRRVEVSNTAIRQGNTGSVWAKGRYVDSFTAKHTRSTTLDASNLAAVDFDATCGLTEFIDSHTNLALSPGSTAKQVVVQKGWFRNLPTYTTGTRPAASSVQVGTPIWDVTINHLLVSTGLTWQDTSVSGGVNATQIQGYDVDPTAPTDGQFLQFQSGINKYKPVTVSLTPPAPASFIDWALEQNSLGYVMPNGFAGAYTVGTVFFTSSASTEITGARFVWQAGVNDTVRISLWRRDSNGGGGGFTRLEFKDVPVTSFGTYTATFTGGGGTGGSWVLDKSRQYMVTMRASVSGYCQVGAFSPVPPTKPPQPFGWGIPLPIKPGLYIENWYVSTFGQTDTAPTVSLSSYTADVSALVEPVANVGGGGGGGGGGTGYSEVDSNGNPISTTRTKLNFTTDFTVTDNSGAARTDVALGSLSPSKITGTAVVGTDIGSVVQGYDADLQALAGISGVRGDILFYGPSGWTRLAKGSLNSFLQQGTNDPAWGTLLGLSQGGTNSNAALSGNRYMTSNSGGTAIVEGNTYEWVIAEQTSSTVAGTPVDVATFTVPVARGSNSTNSFVISDIAFRPTQLAVGGTVNVRAGITLNGEELIKTTQANTLGQNIGDFTSELGTSCPAAKSYTCAVAGGSQIYLRIEGPSAGLSQALRGVWTFAGKQR